MGNRSKVRFTLWVRPRLLGLTALVYPVFPVVKLSWLCVDSTISYLDRECGLEIISDAQLRPPVVGLLPIFLQLVSYRDDDPPTELEVAQPIVKEFRR